MNIKSLCKTLIIARARPMSAKSVFAREAYSSLQAWTLSNFCNNLHQPSITPFLSGKGCFQTLPLSGSGKMCSYSPFWSKAVIAPPRYREGAVNTTSLLLYNQRGSPYRRVRGGSRDLPKSFLKNFLNKFFPVKFNIGRCIAHAISFERIIVDDKKLLEKKQKSAIIPLPARKWGGNSCQAAANNIQNRCTSAKQPFATPLCFLWKGAHSPNTQRSLACLSSVPTVSQPPTEQDQVSRTIVITSGKGGVGKTTTTANLGMSIARLGYRVALIDADIGLRNLDLLLGLENRVLYTAMDIFEGECRLDQALIRDKRLKNLCLLAISKNRQRYNVTRQKMDHLVSSISSLGYHFVLIDCPAGIDVGFINAISPAQEALIVTTPEITAMRDADRVAGLLEANGIYNAKLLINRVRPDMIQRHDMMSVQDVQDVLGIPLLGAIPEDIDVIISTNRGEPLVLRKKLTLSGIAFENAARRLIGKQDYLIDLKTPYKGIFQKIQTLFFNN